MRSGSAFGESLAVVGAGYVGLTTAACMAELGHEVTLVEQDAGRLRLLRRGGVPFHEPGLSELVERGVWAGRLRFTGPGPDAMTGVATAFIAVGTPEGMGGRADLTGVVAATQMVADSARAPLTLVVKSTVPVGTADLLERIVRERSAGDGFDVVSNPEFLREGSAVRDFFEPDRIVVGAADPQVGQRVASLYAALEAPTLILDRRSSELVKYASNAYLATRISFTNELAAIAEATGADITSALRGMGMDRRIGSSFLQPGIGYGGSCLSKDVNGLIAEAKAAGVRAGILQAVQDVNAALPERTVQRLATELKGIHGRRVALLGLAFKPGTDDLRAAPGLALAAHLVNKGARVQAYDPVALRGARERLPQIHGCRDAYEAAERADAVVLATEWPEFLELDFGRMLSAMRGRVVFDGRGALDRVRLQRLGFRYLCFGLGPVSPLSGVEGPKGRDGRAGGRDERARTSPP